MLLFLVLGGTLKAVTMRTGPNDASRIVWAISKFFFFRVFFFILTTIYIANLYDKKRGHEFGMRG